MARKIGNEAILMNSTVTMVTLEARAIMETGDASSWKVNKLSRTHQLRTKMEHG